MPEQLTIPQVRERLTTLALELGNDELFSLIKQLFRRKNCTPTKPRRKSLNAPLADEIRAYKDANPETSYHDIANHFYTSIGRVSEALFGKRGE